MNSPRRYREHNEPSRAQTAAAHPSASVWVSANAGSGKTRVLTTRVARLLLAGAAPSRILCLTYTKAAAAEMQNRLFETLGGWAMAPEEALAEKLDGILAENEPPLARQDRDDARRLFAHALETPGGLRIQTIHAFCESLLSRFPLESGVSPHFQVIDEALADQLRREAIDGVILARDENPELDAALLALFASHDEATISDLLRQALSRRRAYDQSDRAALAQWLGVEAGVTGSGILDGWRARLDESALKKCGDLLCRSTRTADQKHGAALRDCLTADTPREAFDAFCGALLTKDGLGKARLATKELTSAHAWLEEALRQRQAEAQSTRQALAAASCYEASAALDVVAKALISRYRALKLLRAGLDYDDLIDKAVGLLTRSDARDWVRFKLDGGVEHILVDEAQDTSPQQWRAIAALAEEFFAGQGRFEERAREDFEKPTMLARRTIFAVGDEKQSIYSFQGAQPALLSEMGGMFAERAAAVGAAEAVFRRQGLATSFRSAPAILSFVDAVFADEEARQGLVFNGSEVSHSAFRAEAPGRVDLWPLVSRREAEEAPPWDAPLDAPPPDDPERRLARLVADQIRSWIGREPLPSQNRLMRPGDILVLVRSRGRLSASLIKRLKQIDAPVAGQDRLSLTTELAVKDLLALAKFCLFPEDDLTLATLLRSPFCAISEDQLFQLAHFRKHGRPLWYALKERSDEEAGFAEAAGFLQEMIDRADYQRPFELFAHALGPAGGRGRLTGRLGQEAEDPIDEFLAQALAFEAAGAPTLQGFVDWIAAREAEIKREHEHGRDEIRVMTAHGAKGLEAPVVILPDTTRAPSGGRAPMMLDPKTPGLPPIRLGLRGQEPGPVAAIREQAEISEAEEHRRLLYVALTRAEDRLLICGASRRGEPPAHSWYALCAAAMGGLGAPAPSPVTDAAGAALSGRRYDPTPGKQIIPASFDDAEPGALETPDIVEPGWVRMRAPIETAPSDIQPSYLDPEAAHAPLEIGGARPEFARRRGVLLHLLLEKLAEGPAADRRSRADSLLANEAGDLDPPRREEIRDEALRVLDAPAFADLFGPNSYAEIPVSALLPDLGPGETHGLIDRLVIAPDKIRIVDFKSGAIPVAPPPGYLRQLSVYAAALAKIYPDRPIEAALLWTVEPRLDVLTDEDLAAAYHDSARILDRRRSNT